ncbi:OmpW family protein [Agrobacterium vaccinii]|uniref:OmpW/AlkL family protein n=1 Tax=Agrobacterium vaccinii TaxID=2735528 RepID=UPI001E495460|nr:OmpW family protein [Agrobacterium vaccinii]UHS62271.1 OmpW family protein [Agrobacterium vaccinii]
MFAKFRTVTLLATSLCLSLPAALNAADLAPFAPAPTAEEAIAASSAWMLRVRGLGVITHDSGSVDGVAGAGLAYSDTVIPEFDVSYFFTDNIAAELILGTTFSKIKTTGSIGDIDVGKTWLLPPTVTLQYHFTNFGAFKPYVGAGVNYSLFYNQSEKNGFTNLDVKNDFGAALQVGFDYMVTKNWGVNFDVKKIFLETKWSADLNGTPVSGKAKLDPWLIGAGVTYRF